MITDKLRETFRRATGLMTLTLVSQTLKRCHDNLTRLGISPETMSFLNLFLEKYLIETNEANEELRQELDKNEFDKIVKNFHKKEDDK